MNSPPDINLILDIESRSKAIEELEVYLNEKLRSSFESNKNSDRAKLATFLVEKIENLVDDLNQYSYNLGRIDYAGDINYEKSEQTFSNKLDGQGRLLLEFKGFTCNVIWD